MDARIGRELAWEEELKESTQWNMEAASMCTPLARVPQSAMLKTLLEFRGPIPVYVLGDVFWPRWTIFALAFPHALAPSRRPDAPCAAGLRGAGTIASPREPNRQPNGLPDEESYGKSYRQSTANPS